jgi:hypothetical protein
MYCPLPLLGIKEWKKLLCRVKEEWYGIAMFALGCGQQAYMHILLVVICICNSEPHVVVIPTYSHVTSPYHTQHALYLVQFGSNSVNKSINVCKLLQFLVWFCDILEVT